MQKNVSDLLHKKMSRKEFLATLGLGLVSILGFSNLLKMLDGGKSTKIQSGGYGSSSYGGDKRP